MGTMRYKPSDKVRIKGTDIEGTVESIIRGQLIVNFKGSKIRVWPEDVVLMESVEEKTKPKYEDEVNGEYYSTPKYLVRPSGYQFVDENNNVINATKIVLEKKKKEYPKAYKECCEVLGVSEFEYNHTGTKVWYRHKLMATLDKLMLCRDAYWKIAGEEMGLGKPWEPDYDSLKTKYTIEVIENKVVVISTISENHILAFPTEAMRDAFYDNFKEEIENCKELL